MRQIKSIEDVQQAHDDGEILRWLVDEASSGKYGVLTTDAIHHVGSCLESLAMERLGHGVGGDFVKAVERNDLIGAFARADDINERYIGAYAKFLYNYLPMRKRGDNES